MSITLETYYERTIWNEWSNRIKMFSHRKIRQLFFPNNMDALDLIVNDFIKKRREAIELCRNFKLLPLRDSTQDEYNIWKNHTDNIYKFSNTIFDHMMDDFHPTQFIEELVDMEYTRLHTLEVLMAIRIQKAEKEKQKAEEEEAVEGLMLLRKRELQAKARQEKKEEKKKNPPPIRRSVRIAHNIMENIQKNCRGCIEGQPNQMAHIGPQGCLGAEW